jgi:hypothetical protein
MALNCNPVQRSGGSSFEVSPGQIVPRDPVLKVNNTKRADGMTQVVEHLPSKCEALSTNQQTLVPPTQSKKIAGKDEGKGRTLTHCG